MSIEPRGWGSRVWHGKNTRVILSERGGVEGFRITPALLSRTGMTTDQRRAAWLARQHAQFDVREPAPETAEANAGVVKVQQTASSALSTVKAYAMATKSIHGGDVGDALEPAFAVLESIIAYLNDTDALDRDADNKICDFCYRYVKGDGAEPYSPAVASLACFVMDVVAWNRSYVRAAAAAEKQAAIESAIATRPEPDPEVARLAKRLRAGITSIPDAWVHEAADLLETLSRESEHRAAAVRHCARFLNRVVSAIGWDGSASIPDDAEAIARRVSEMKEERDRLKALVNTPGTDDFLENVRTEAAHQIERWGSQHDAGKSDADWFWLLGWLAGKAVQAGAAGRRDRALHHVITTAAACLNWHRALTGTSTAMRPGIADPEAR